MNFFERVFINQEFFNISQTKITNVISMSHISKRSLFNYIEKNKISFNFNHILIDYDPSKDEISIVKNDETIKYDLNSECQKFISSLSKNIPILIDITNIDLRVLGTLLYNLKLEKYEKILCAYITPEKYSKSKKNNKNDFEIENDLFDLYSSNEGQKSITGFITENYNSLPEKWIVMLGFEGKRTQQLYEEKEFDSVIPVLTLPAIKPGWQNYALYANMFFLQKKSEKCELISACSIIEIYEKMDEWRNSYSDYFLEISPLGTKINSLGMFLYILNNPNSYYILYDNPIPTKDNTIGMANCFIYDITEILNY